MFYQNLISELTGVTDTIELPLIFGASLEECCDYLNGLDDETSQRIDLTSLPTFGGSDIENTSEVFSWDENRVLVQGEQSWELQRRCSECGEAMFHCDH